MSQSLTYGSVRGAAGDGGPYRDCSCSIVPPPNGSRRCRIDYEHEHRVAEHEQEAVGVVHGAALLS